MNVLFCALTKEEFNRVSTATSVNQIWFELFKMMENETISEIIIRFTDITNSFASFGKEYTQVEKVRKILRALTSDWEKKTTAI